MREKTSDKISPPGDPASGSTAATPEPRNPAAADLERRIQLSHDAENARAQGRLSEAETLLREAMVIDPKHPGTHQKLAEVVAALGREAEAHQLHKMAEALRKEAWQRQVEAEIRGRHEVMKDL